MPTITFLTDDNNHERYIKISKKIKSRGIDINKSVPNFLVDRLEAEERKHFPNLKKYHNEGIRRLIDEKSL
jgi:hypothetical protein